MELTKAAADVLAERRRQIFTEGWTPEHDDEHDCGELADAAACYAANAGSAVWASDVPDFWPWSPEWWKPRNRRDRRDDLVRAGALILAEIERLDRRPQGRCRNSECGWIGALADAIQKDGAYFCPYNGLDVVTPNRY